MQKKNLGRSGSGFTIVELLIVIVVIAILATLAVVSYNGIRERATSSGAATSTEQAVKKVLSYAVEHSDTYPTTLAEVGIVDTNTTTYQYSVDNVSNPRTFCITTTIQSTNYYASSAITRPIAGACLGHSTGAPISTEIDWTPITSTGTRRWLGVAGSGDGSTWIAGGYEGYVTTYIYSSSNAGVTWTNLTTDSDSWKAFAISANGSRMYGVPDGGSGRFWKSLNSGATWAQDTTINVYYWNDVDTSADGLKVLAAAQGGLYGTMGFTYYSSDGTANWSFTTAHVFQGVTMSTDGTRWYGAKAIGYVFVSTDNGSSWTQLNGGGSRDWRAIATSSNGSKITGVNKNEYIYTSSDSGVTWAQYTGTGTKSWADVAISADGTRQVAVVNNGYIYNSVDSGATWVEQTAAGSRAWRSVDTSADGLKVVAVDNDGYVYVGEY